jgi:LAO/AO transport system kinase
MVHDGVLARVHADPAVAERVRGLEARLRAGQITAAMAADDILDALGM